MNEKTHFDRVQEILGLVLDTPEQERDRHLAEVCDGDSELIAEVRTLLDAPVPTYLDGDAFDLAEESSSMPASRTVGPYRLLGQLGSGGMSRVFEAERTDGELERRVAIKMLRTFVGEEGVGAQRFRLERQVLASLSHPSIAEVFDGGVTADGQPYLVMGSSTAARSPSTALAKR